MLYWIGMVLIIIGGGLSALATLVGGLLSGDGMQMVGGAFGSLLVVVVTVIWLVLWRFYSELSLLLFNIHDCLNRIEKKLSK